MWLIDGYNLLFALKRGRIDFSRLREEREDLLRRIGLLLEGGRRKAVVVFDHARSAPLPGLPSRSARGGIEVRFTAPGETADEVVVRIAASTPDRRAFKVVTSDAAVRDAVAKRGVEVATSQSFAAEILRIEAASSRAAEPPPRERPPSKGEVDEWMRIYGIQE